MRRDLVNFAIKAFAPRMSTSLLEFYADATRCWDLSQPNPVQFE